MNTFSALLRAADAPAHEAVRLSRVPILHTVVPLAVGVSALSAATLAIAALREHPGQAPAAIGAVLEPVLTVAPIAMVLVALGPKVSPRVVTAALALGLLTAGWVALGLVPLAAFTALVSARSGPGVLGDVGWALDAFGLLVAIVSLGSVAMVVERVLGALDPAAKQLARGFGAAIFGVFFIRSFPWIERLFSGGLPW